VGKGQGEEEIKQYSFEIGATPFGVCPFSFLVCFMQVALNGTPMLQL
jgi:hypothetical protein